MNTNISADFQYIEIALAARRNACTTLFAEIDDFHPLPRTEFARSRESDVKRLSELNPHQSRTSIENLIDKQIDMKCSNDVQFLDKFQDALMNEYVSVLFLSHALCEALINAILAIGLTHSGTHELFALIEKGRLVDKWCDGPKVITADYKLPRDGNMFEDLIHLTRQRNTFTHYKVTLHVDETQVLKGTSPAHLSMQEIRRWTTRLLDLPYALERHAQSQVKTPAWPLLYFSLDQLKKKKSSSR